MEQAAPGIRMSARLKAEIWVAAYLRSVRAQGAFAYLVRRGAEEAGSILLKVEAPGGTATVYSPGYMDGVRTWLRSSGTEPVPATEADSYIQRRLATDPDLWVVEVEDRAGRHFLTEPVEGEETNP